ncbi:hypothetical protein TNCV_4705291 [Trichonephila clavipes]|nr:hypothetical protein TNCV_4705291 [Trichonephila clavipes]
MSSSPIANENSLCRGVDVRVMWWLEVHTLACCRMARQTRVDLGFLKEPYPGQPDYLDEPRTPARDGKSLPMIFFQNCYLRTILTQRQISR